MIKCLSAIAGAFIIIFFASCALAAGQEIVKLAEDANITADMVVDDVVVIGGNATISGKVNNGVVVVGGSLELKPGSSVAEHVVVVGGEIIKAPTAEVKGKITQIYMPHFIPSLPSILKGGWIALWATISILVLLGFLGLAILLVALIPQHMAAAVDAIRNSFRNMLLLGILWMVLIVPIAVLLAISIIGILLIPLEILLAVLALIIGYIASAIFIGKNILMSLGKASTHPFVDAIVGILILFLIGFVPVVGQVVKALFLLAGFGAVIVTRFGTCRKGPI